MNPPAAAVVTNSSSRRAPSPIRPRVTPMVAWSAAAPKPLVVHAFLLDPAAAGRPAKDCAHLQIGATPQVSASGGHLVLATRDAQIDEVEGSAAVKAGLFFSGVGRRSFEHVESIAAQTDFDAQPAGAEREAARTRGKTMNILAITGGIAGGLLIGAGVALLVIGLNKNKHARIQHNMSVLPTAGPNSAGLALTGRF